MKTILIIILASRILFAGTELNAQNSFSFNTGEAGEKNLTIIVDCNQDSLETNISIRDLTGKVVSSQELILNCGKVLLNIETLPRGVYVIAMSPKNSSSVATKKFSKN